MKYSLLKNDTKSRVQKLKEKYDILSINKKSEENTKKRTGSNIRDDISKIGLSNTLMGTTQVLNNQNKSILKENTMSKIVLPIKSIILEFTADHIRDNAGKYAAGTMLGLGATAGYLAGDPEHGGGLLNHDNHSNDNTPVSGKDTRSDFQKDLAGASSTTNTTYHNQDRGLIGNLSNAASKFSQDIRSENKFNDLTQAQKDYNDIKNNEGSLLSGGQIAGLGAGVLGAGALAAKLKRK